MTSDFPLRHHFDGKPEKDPRCVRCGIFFSKVVPLDGRSLIPCAENRIVAIADRLMERIAEAFSGTGKAYGKIEAKIALGILFNLAAVTAVDSGVTGEDFVRIADLAYEGMLRETKEDS